MMKKCCFIFLLCTIGSLTQAQNFTSVLGGSWTASLTTWGNIFGNYPQTGDNATITALNTVTVAGTEQCEDVTVNGTLQVNGGGSLEAGNLLDVNTTGEVQITSGHVTVQGNFNHDGTLTITPGTSNYIQVHGDITNGGLTRIQTNSGSIIIYSNLAF